MSVWQDQTPRRPGAGTATGPAAVDPGRPQSRREARERERQAAEALATGQDHPSGVVDFDGYDFDPDFHPERGFGEQDTADIWAALSRRSHQPQAPQPSAPQPTAPEGGHDVALPPVTDELMDRVRGAVLRRDRQEPVDPTAIAPVVRPSGLAPAVPAQPGLPSRRALRREEAGRTTEDGLPSAWFSDAPAAFGGGGGTAVDDVPPTVAMQMPVLDRAELDARAPVTARVNLPGALVQPAGDDAVAFSSIAPLAAPAAPARPAALVEPAFVQPAPEPPQPWTVRHQAWSAEPTDERAQPWTDPQALVTATPAWSDAPVTPAAAPAADAWVDQQPYSEPTDLAGFEALIKRARGAQPAPQRLPQADVAARPWAEPDALQTSDRIDRSAFERAVTAPHGASNALVLPEDPTPDLTQAVSRTGDLFITGSMKLPRSLSTTGATEQHYDGLDVDRLYEAAHADAAPGVAPVRATRAVGQASAGRTVVGRRGRGNVLPTVLAVVAGAMAVGVLVLLVGSWVLKLF